MLRQMSRQVNLRQNRDYPEFKITRSGIHSNLSDLMLCPGEYSLWGANQQWVSPYFASVYYLGHQHVCSNVHESSLSCALVLEQRHMV